MEIIISKLNEVKQNLALAMLVLIPAGSIGIIQFGIIELVRRYTGWTMPYWLALTVDLLGTAGAIVGAVASFGVTLPLAVAKIAAVTVGAWA